MHIVDIIRHDQFVDKIARKHGLSIEEVEEVFENNPLFRRSSKGNFPGEDVYYAFGQWDSGRYIFVVFIYKSDSTALVISAREMDAKERKFVTIQYNHGITHQIQKNDLDTGFRRHD
jgi:uncharacterized protein